MWQIWDNDIYSRDHKGALFIIDLIGSVLLIVFGPRDLLPPD